MKKKNNKIGYSLFSINTGILVFVTTSISVLYSFFIFSRAYTRIAAQSSLDSWQLSILVLLFLCLTDTMVLLIYRRLIIKKPLMKILDATERIGAGDFSVRLHVKKDARFLNEYDVVLQNINHMAEELEGIETLRKDFVANVSHEFKAPLAVMQNSCTIIMQPEISDADRIKYAKNISDASRRMATMVTNVLTLSKIESQKIVTKKDKINITELLRDEILIYESMWDNKNIEIEVDAQEDVEIYSDRELLSILWRNLLSNAFKFTPENGKVTVAVKEKADILAVSVSDSGDGIPPDKLERIFERFYQADTSHATQGNGLGLALVKSISDILGYGISVQSEPGEGSCFTVTMKK